MSHFKLEINCNSEEQRNVIIAALSTWDIVLDEVNNVIFYDSNKIDKDNIKVDRKHSIITYPYNDVISEYE